MDPAVGVWLDPFQFQGEDAGYQIEVARFDKAVSAWIHHAEFPAHRKMQAVVDFSGKHLKSRPGLDVVGLSAFDGLHVQFREELIPDEVVVAFLVAVFNHMGISCGFTISQVRLECKRDWRVIHSFCFCWGGVMEDFTKSPKKINKRYIYRCSKICYNMQRSTWERSKGDRGD